MKIGLVIVIMTAARVPESWGCRPGRVYLHRTEPPTGEYNKQYIFIYMMIIIVMIMIMMIIMMIIMIIIIMIIMIIATSV